jgi:hypothetical protein
MSRPAIAAVAGVIGFLLYVALAVTIGGYLAGSHVLVEFAFYAVAGLAWVWPARRLMFWAARRAPLKP